MSKRAMGRVTPPHKRWPVAWYQPDVLYVAAKQVLSSEDYLRNMDKRELFKPLTVIALDPERAEQPFTFDFISDTGDGGNATYAVAHTAFAPMLTTTITTPETTETGERITKTESIDLPQGELLVLGGDLSYPAASPDEYQYRFVDLFDGARRDLKVGKYANRHLLAIPQNHDWMDSTSTFRRYFTRNENDSRRTFGAQLHQDQTYFCAQLPHGWWILGLDFASEKDIDRQQYEGFEALIRAHIPKEARVIIVYPEPFWTRPLGDGALLGRPKRYQQLEGMLGKHRIALRIAGDLHHYKRWTSEKDGMIITCGTGGAFTHPTHTTRVQRNIYARAHKNEFAIDPVRHKLAYLQVGQGDVSATEEEWREFKSDETKEYPNAQDSRAMVWRIWWALFRSNGKWCQGNILFAVMLGGIYGFIAYLNLPPFSLAFAAEGFAPMSDLYRDSQLWRAAKLWWRAMFFSPLAFMINAVVIAACVTMGRELQGELAPSSSPLKRWASVIGAGLLHGAIHAFAIFVLTYYVFGWMHAQGALVVTSLLAVGAFGCIVGTLIFGGYLTLWARCGYMTNNAFSPLACEDFKGFLRCRINSNGSLEAWFIAIENVPRKWRISAAASGPIWEPENGQAPLTTVKDTFTIPARE